MLANARNHIVSYLKITSSKCADPSRGFFLQKRRKIMKKRANRKLRHKLAHPRHKNCSDHFFMAIFVFSTKKPMGIAASMNEKLRNVALMDIRRILYDFLILDA